jgi:cytochrome c-type biogenesis protein CcmH/NrfG
MATAKPTEPTPDPKRRTHDKYTLAAKLARRLEQLRRDTDAELLTTPKSIEDRYEAKRRALLADASPEVLDVLPAGMLRDGERK